MTGPIAAAGLPRRQGFTLVETLVVLAVLALLLGLGVPGLAAFRERQQLQAQAQDFWNSLMLARTQALLHQQHVTVCTAPDLQNCSSDAAWHAGWLVFVDSNRNGRREPHERLLQQRGPAPAGVRMQGNSTVRQTIGYSAEGRSENLRGGFQAGTVTLCMPDQPMGWQVVINAVGRSRLESAEVPDCP